MKKNHQSAEQNFGYNSDWSFYCLCVFAGINILILSADLLSLNWPSETTYMMSAAAVIVCGLSILILKLATRKGAAKAAQENRTNRSNSTQLETIGRLAGGVAHDFNNSLMVLLNCIEMLSHAEDSSARQKLLTDMESAARGAQSTAEQLMSLSTEGSAPGQPSEPRVALRSLASNLRRMFPENINVQDMLRGTPPVTLVSGQFEQVILNICLNAKDSMPDGGTLTLRCFKEPLANEVVIEIEDTGTRNIDARRQALENGERYQNITRSGGRISTRVVDSSGLCTTLTLPIAEQRKNNDTPATKLPVNTNLRALLLDDNELVLSMLSTRLEEAGYRVTTALSAREALRFVESEKFDVMVSDAVLTDGIPTEAINTFSQQSDGLLVICSGYPKDDPILADLRTNEAIFLQKPFSTDELLHKLDCENQAA